MTAKLSTYKNKMQALGVAAISTLLCATPAFADGDLQGLLLGAINAVRTIISAIFNPLCIVALGVCIAILVLGRNSKSADSSMSWAKRIVICFIVFNILGTLVTWLTGTAFSGASGFDDVYTGFIQGLMF